ncbi:MAG: hypothetical protein QXR57_07745 [Metallosphaera sp.]|uniref:Uncharacterized protein n=1 Tax=Metallosphaera cuprina (strain Ar-4) TaxID=1006006 RepID=F4FZT0_METCR|nr:hypothetical protein [Metallosphaera cuprina]AEB94509.1 conserved hypothetical protein [Metallosphaera cuprina Ar-4]
MENFLRDPAPEAASKLLSQIYTRREICVSGPYDPDFTIFAGLIAKYFKGDMGFSFSSECEVRAEKRESGNFLVIDGSETYLGNSSFSSLHPLTSEDLVPILAGISSDALLYRRGLTNWEENLLLKAEELGVSSERTLNVPGYHEIPLFLSLTYSVNLSIPDITGNRENSLKLVNELGGNEFTKLSELDESQLNSLIFRLISLISKFNPKISREDLITPRYLYHSYDSLELGLVSVYVLDRRGYQALFDLTLNHSLYGVMIASFREVLGRGFSFEVKEEADKYVVNSQLESPLLAYLALKQQGKIRGRKPVYVVNGDKVFTSRFFKVGGNDVREG